MHAPGARQDCKGDFRRVKVARTICEWTFFHKSDFMNDLMNYFKTTSYPFSLVITHSWTDVYGHPVRFQLVSALDLPHEFRGRSTTWCPETCQDCGSADSVSPRPARIADQADYGPLHPARATRADLVSSRNLPAGQADHSPLISPVCGSGSLILMFGPLTSSNCFHPQAVEVRGIHHRANLSFCAKGKLCRNFGRSLRKF
ncbi:hypothetical protein Prudu_001211 [Prunus dulcis]|uniref:Uncharacterized protein n=1 Tax=Prunus dulcis TaxID=3755 RepID=A0A4Y1QN36_PRUDU|nr:hypothetical protein Prudu_001211 [Prunus dulcis]